MLGLFAERMADLAGLIGTCPAYTLFGWNTCSMKNKT
ncbi:MAG: YgaP family membrane protein [Polaromonas sp.]